MLLVGHYDTVPAQDNVPGRIADGAVHGCGATDMKGGVAVALELVRDLARAEPGPDRRGAAPLRQGGAAGAVQPAPGPLRALAARVRRRPRDPARADRSDDPGRLSRQHERDDHLLRRQRPLGAALDGRERDREGDRGPGADRRARAPRSRRRRPAVLRGRVDHPARGGDRGQRDPRPCGRDASTSATRPTARPESAAEYLRALDAGRRDARDHGRLAARHGRHGHAARPRAARRRRPRASSPSRPGRTSRTSRPAESTRSTSARARPATPIAATSRSRSPPSRPRTRRCTASSPAERRAGLPHPPRPGDLPVRAPQPGCSRSPGAPGSR